MMSRAYLAVLAEAGATAVRYLGLVDDAGRELRGGLPAYARQATRWVTTPEGTIQPAEDLIFQVPAGFIVAGWRGYDAPTAGTSYGGADLTPEAFAGQGQYRLLAEQTGIRHG